MLSHYLSLSVGLVCAAIGGELFVRGLVGVAAWARVPARVIGATIAAFATSSPELTVAINAAADERPEIALGDALGSNLVNVGLVLGLVLLAGATAGADLSRRDALTAVSIAVLLGFLIIDGELARTDGVVLLFVFASWLSVVVREAFAARVAHGIASEDPEILGAISERGHRRAVLFAALGLVALVIAGRLLVVGAKGIGADLGLSTFVIGVVLISVGTSLPELATAIAAKVRGHAELGLGTLLGSNIFNVSFIVGVTVVLVPIDVDRGDVAISLIFGIAMFPVVLWRVTGETLSRWRGGLLIAIYVIALVTLVVVQR